MLKRLTAGLLCCMLVTTGCASSGMRAAQAAPPPAFDQQVMKDYVAKLPAGSRVRIEQTDGRSFRGTLMSTTATAVVVQKATRVPEPPIEVPIARVARITLDMPSGSTGRSIGIGIAAGVGATLGFLAILAAAISD
jgi:hypothetical protein